MRLVASSTSESSDNDAKRIHIYKTLRGRGRVLPSPKQPSLIFVVQCVLNSFDKVHQLYDSLTLA